MANVAVEVAIGAFGRAERPVHIDTESGIGWDMWTVPNSLRETEPEINLQLLTFDPTIDNPSSHVPKWAPASAQTTSGDQGGEHDA